MMGAAARLGWTDGRTDSHTQTILGRRLGGGGAATGGETGSDERVRPWVRPPPREGLACLFKFDVLLFWGLPTSSCGGSSASLMIAVCSRFATPALWPLREAPDGHCTRTVRPVGRPCPPKLS